MVGVLLLLTSLFFNLLDMDIYTLLGLADFSSFANALEVVGSFGGVDGFVKVVVRGVEIMYDVTFNFAYCDTVELGHSGSALWEFTWNADTERYEWNR